MIAIAAQPRAAPPQPYMAVEDLRVALGHNLILRGVSCDVGKGQLVGVIGPNGSGKTTLLRTMAGLLQPDSGRITLDGADASTTTARERARSVAYLPQSSSSGFSFTAFEVALMGRYPRLGRFELEGAADRRIALNALERTRTAQFADRRIGELSGGERQRVLMARTLAQEPDLLLLDEPTSNLDLKHQLALMALVAEEVANGLAAVAVMHDLSLAARFCDRLLLLHEGRIMAAGTPQDVLTPENLLAAFEVNATVSKDPLTGRPRIALTGPADGLDAAADAAATVHLICGAGSGRYLMQSLVSAGYRVTLGILGEGDTDREAADHLGVPYVPTAMFSAPGLDELNGHESLVARADVIVVCDMPIGHNNLGNVAAAAQAKNLILVEDRPIAERDYTEGAASALYDRLARTAVITPGHIALAAIRASLSEEEEAP